MQLRSTAVAYFPKNLMSLDLFFTAMMMTMINNDDDDDDDERIYFIVARSLKTARTCNGIQKEKSQQYQTETQTDLCK